MLKKYHLVYLLFTLIFILSCRDNFEGYSEVNDGVHVKLISFDDSVQVYQTGNFIKASFNVFDKNELKYKQYKYIPFLPTNQKFDKIFTQLNKGDSVDLLVLRSIFDDNSFGFTSNDIKSDYIGVSVKIHDFLDEEKYENYQAVKDDELIEQLILKKYLKDEKNVKTIDGIYYTKLKETSNKTIKRGDEIKIRYVGSFINGVVFDKTFNKQSFEFRYGTPNQVIEGLEKVLKVLKNGEKAKIIIPSQFAFGEKGSSTGIVPPYSTVIYNLEIINIK